MNPDPRQKMFTRWTTRWSRNALAISILFHGAFIVAAIFIVAIQTYKKPQTQLIAHEQKRPALELRKLEMKVNVQDMQKSSARPKLRPRMVAMAPSEVVMPDIKKMPTDPTLKLRRDASAFGRAGGGKGLWDDLGDGISDGIGGGKGFDVGVPKFMSGRCSSIERATRLAEKGGDVRVEEAVTKALNWFKQNQNPDGSWGKEHRAAMTGLALLCFFGRCETNISEEYGSTVARGLEFLVSLGAAKNGRLSENPSGMHYPYEHGIATFALGEAWSMTKLEQIKPTLETALKIIMDGQDPKTGGWHYNYDKNGSFDVSVTGWQIQALKAAHLGDLKIPDLENAINRAVNALRNGQGEDGTFPYQSDGSTKGGRSTLTGVGVLCMQLWRPASGSRAVRSGLKHILDTRVVEYNGKDADLYAWYYDTYAAFMAGGQSWRSWNAKFQQEILKNQNPDGSWKPTGGGGGHPGGGAPDPTWDVYRTALCTLMLEVFYRYLPTSG